ncbi:glycosyltransferase [uncultured Polaribacter sp.]|uniref:glycosyltransferase family 2 protein n=1 Tax=uncultured Polaribacter sp. TaxID=174711 RepID=UPI00261164C6|nr:glycosyltransferase [uncultured Polaribacter sp.]
MSKFIFSVSVIIPTFNRSKYLEEAILSVVNQTYEDIEILVIDDGSKENYAENICRKYNNCFYYHKNNGGLSSARNYGISKAKGKYIAFLDDDDVWKKNKLEVQCKILDKDTDIACVHSSAIVINEKGKVTGKVIGASEAKAYKRSGNVFWNALGVWVVKSPTPLIRRKVFTRDLLFDETIKIGEDLDFYQRMFYRHKVVYINKPLAFYREYQDVTRLSLQKQKYIGIERKIYNNFVKMGIKNPFVLQKIASKLLISGVKRYNLLYPKKPIELSFLDKYIFPQKKIKELI